MLTSRRLFDGETVTDTLSAVLTKEPDWNRVPTKAQRLLQSCLQKDPKHRLRDIADAWRLLEDAPMQAAGNAEPWKLTAAASVLICAIALWAPWRRAARPIEPPSLRLDLDLGPDVWFGSTTGPAVMLSPDGARLVFVSEDREGTPR